MMPNGLPLGSVWSMKIFSVASRPPSVISATPSLMLLLPLLQKLPTLGFKNSVQKISLNFNMPARPSFFGTTVECVQIVVDDVPPIDREHPSVRVGFVAVRRLVHRAVLNLAVGRERIERQSIEQTNGRDFLEVLHGANVRDSQARLVNASQPSRTNLLAMLPRVVGNENVDQPVA